MLFVDRRAIFFRDGASQVEPTQARALVTLLAFENSNVRRKREEELPPGNGARLACWLQNDPAGRARRFSILQLLHVTCRVEGWAGHRSRTTFGVAELVSR